MSSESLVGKYFIDSMDDNMYRTGKVLDVVSEGVYLLSPDAMQDKGMRMPMGLVGIGCMAAHYEFFNTRDELDAYIKWVDAPAENKPAVVSLVKK